MSEVDDYIAALPSEVRGPLEEVRAAAHETVRSLVPESVEVGERISYRIPAVTVDGRALLYVAGWNRFISVYPVPVGDEAYRESSAPYRVAKGTLRFPLGKPMPLDLVRSTAAFLLHERRR